VSGKAASPERNRHEARGPAAPPARGARRIRPQPPRHQDGLPLRRVRRAPRHQARVHKAVAVRVSDHGRSV